MATITSLGIGSGLDLNTIVDKLVALERAPVQDLQKAATQLQTQVSAVGKMQSLFSTLQDASSALSSSTLWARSQASSGDDTAVAVNGGSNAAAGSYAVTVQALAASQTLSSDTVFASASDLVGSGTLSLSLGSWDSTRSTFTGKTDNVPVAVTVSATDTVQTLRDKINASGSGVTATLVTDTRGVRLALRSSASGADNGFKITTDSSDANGLARFAYDPSSGATGMDFKEAAANARATVNGIDVQSASNDITGAIDGLTLTLRKASSTPVAVSVSRDRAAVVTSIKTFADAYNALATYIAQQTKYDSSSKVAGALQGDSAITGLQARMRAVLATGTGASTSFPRLSDVGLQVQRDGTLSVNQSKLDSATGNLDELKKAFANTDATTPANDGFARRYGTLATQALGIDGSLTTRTAGLQKLISKNSDDQAKVNDRADSYQARLVQQYTALDATQSRLTALSSYMTAQLAALTKTSA